MSKIDLARLTGDDMTAVLGDLAQLRITVFREWPYLYDGDFDYERKYLTKFAASEGAVIIGASDADQLVGAATAAPLSDHFDDFAEPFRQAGLDPQHYFYFGESVLLQPYRGQGIGVRFFEEREAAAKAAGYERVAFCGVVRPGDHPSKPADYVPLDQFWRNRGYQPMEGITCEFPWRDIGDQHETPKRMQFWSRHLT